MKRILASLCFAAVLTGFTAYVPAARASDDDTAGVARENMREYNAALQQQAQQFFRQQQAQQLQQMQQNNNPQQ